MCEDVDTAVFARRRYPCDVVAHCLQKVCDQFLKLVRIHSAQVLLDFSPCLLLGLLKRDPYSLLALIVFEGDLSADLLGRARSAARPFPIEAESLLVKGFRIGKCSVSFFAGRSDRLSALVLDEPTGLHAFDCCESDNLFEATPAFVVASFILGQGNRGRETTERVSCSKAFGLRQENLEELAEQLSRAPYRDFRHVACLDHRTAPGNRSASELAAMSQRKCVLPPT